MAHLSIARMIPGTAVGFRLPPNAVGVARCRALSRVRAGERGPKPFALHASRVHNGPERFAPFRGLTTTLQDRALRRDPLTTENLGRQIVTTMPGRSFAGVRRYILCTIFGEITRRWPRDAVVHTVPPIAAWNPGTAGVHHPGNRPGLSDSAAAVS